MYIEHRQILKVVDNWSIISTAVPTLHSSITFHGKAIWKAVLTVEGTVLFGPFFMYTANWFVWQTTQMSDKSLLFRAEKNDIWTKSDNPSPVERNLWCWVTSVAQNIMLYVIAQIQGDFFNWPPPKNHKFKKKLEYPDWPPPKISKCQLR